MPARGIQYYSIGQGLSSIHQRRRIFLVLQQHAAQNQNRWACADVPAFSAEGGDDRKEVGFAQVFLMKVLLQEVWPFALEKNIVLF